MFNKLAKSSYDETALERVQWGRHSHIMLASMQTVSNFLISSQLWLFVTRIKIFFLPNYNKILPKYKASLRNSISPPASPPLLFPWLILWYVNLTGTWSTLDIWSNIILDAPARMVLDEIYI